MNKKIFPLIILFHLVTWLALKPVWPFSDDYCYAFHANTYFSPTFHLTDNVFQNRYGVNLPTSIIFYFFGINPYTISLWPLISSILTIVVVYIFISKIIDIKTALISCALISLNILQITYSIALFPDIFIALFSTGSILLLYYGREQKIGNKYYPLLFIFCLFAGALTKETIILVFPFILFVFIFDFYKKNNFQFWKQSLIFSGIFLCLYLALFYILHGDFFYKINATINYNNAGLYDQEMKDFVLTNYHQNIFKWLNAELGLFFILLFSIPILLTVQKFNLSNFKIFVSIYAISILLSLVILFQTDKYGILFMMDRLWIITIAPLSISTALLIAEDKKGYYLYLMILFFILIVYNYFAVSFERAVLFGLFFIATTFSYFFKNRIKYSNLFLLFPLLILTINFVYNNSNYKGGTLQSSDIIKKEIEKLNYSNKNIILTDSNFVENHIIYNGFEAYSNLTFYSFDKYDSVSRLSNLYAIVNTENEDVPEFILKNYKNWEKKFDSKNLLIYKKIE